MPVIFHVVMILTCVCLLGTAALADVPGTINIQGRLTDSAGTPPIAGPKTFTFKIYSLEAGGSVQWPDPPGEIQIVDTDMDGLWTAQLGALIPLTKAVFSDPSRWLEITVDDGVNPAETLPRVRLDTSPYSFRAGVADSALVVAGGGGAFLPLAGGTMTGPIGNTGNPPIAMGKGNFGSENSNPGTGAFVAGEANIAGGNYSAVGGGKNDTAMGSYAAVAGGVRNTADGDVTFVGGGADNRSSAWGTAVLGGTSNHASQFNSTVGGGDHNLAFGTYSFVGGGLKNDAHGTHSVIGGGEAGTIINLGNYSVIGGGDRNTIWAPRAVIAGGGSHFNAGTYSVIAGGYADTISSTGDYSYLFGIRSKLTQDSTFMVDLPHVVFGDETSGYEFPAARGASGQVMSSDASGKLSWTDQSVSTPSGWTDGGAVVRLTTTADKVAIGATTTTAKLGVTGIVRITDNTPARALDVVNTYVGGVSQVVNIERTDSVPGSNDMLQIKVPSNSVNTFQFIECERGTDLMFRVNGDGNVYADGAYTGPADFSEMIAVSGGASTAEAGDVMVIDPANPRAIVKAASPRSRLAAGIYSTKPGFVGSERDWDKASATGDEQGTYSRREMAEVFDEIPLAVVGIVPCKVSAENGAIAPGDLLVTSSTPGHAMRDDQPRVGTVIGKALGSLPSGTGVMSVLVTLQ